MSGKEGRGVPELFILLNKLKVRGKIDIILGILLKYNLSLKDVFPEEENAILRHRLGSLIGKIRKAADSGEATREIESARITVSNLVGCGEVNLPIHNFEYFIPKDYKAKVHDLQNHDDIIDWEVIVFNQQKNTGKFKENVSYNLQLLLHEFDDIISANLIELFHKEIEKNWKFRLNCNVFMLEGKGDKEGFFIDNNGPLINDEMFMKLGSGGITSKSDAVNHGIGLNGLATSASKLGYQFICAQWDKERLMINDLGNRQAKEFSIKENNSDPLFNLGKEIMDTSIASWISSGVNPKYRKAPNVAFGIVGNKGNFFHNPTSK